MFLIDEIWHKLLAFYVFYNKFQSRMLIKIKNEKIVSTIFSEIIRVSETHMKHVEWKKKAILA